MPYGRKSALRRVKAGGGFGKSLVHTHGGPAADSHHQKPDINRLRCNQSAEGEQVKLSKFLTRDQNVTTLETNDYEDFLQLSLFKKVGTRDLVICNRDGRTFSTKEGGETTSTAKANISGARETSLVSVALPIRPFIFTDHMSRIIDLSNWIEGDRDNDVTEDGGKQSEHEAGQGSSELRDLAADADGVESVELAAGGDNHDDASSSSDVSAEGSDDDETASSDSTAEEIKEEDATLLHSIAAYFLTQKCRLAPLLTPEEIEFEEARVFSDWRNYVTELQHDSKLVLTPYEKNLSYWRELWRTLERSDLVLEIVDARNPLLFRSQALEDHITSLGKAFRLCINKADHLSQRQCDVWRDYCVTHLGLQQPLIYSSMRELKKLDPLNHEDQFISINTADTLDHLTSVENLTSYLNTECVRAIERKTARATEARKLYRNILDRLSKISPRTLAKSYNIMRKEARKLILGDLLDDKAVRAMDAGPKYTRLTSNDYLKMLLGNCDLSSDSESLRFYVGTIGFPNVGKSSIINSLMKGSARVGVSRTPGKTRHIQTLKIPESHNALWLCDCPGLVLPIRAGSREDLIINGVISVGTIRGTSTKVVEHLLVRVADQIEELYNCRIDKKSHVLQVLESLATARGFYKSGKGGLPDVEKMSRILIKQFLDGRSLSFCELPPECAVAAEVWLKEEEEKWFVRRNFLNKNLSSLI